MFLGFILNLTRKWTGDLCGEVTTWISLFCCYKTMTVQKLWHYHVNRGHFSKKLHFSKHSFSRDWTLSPPWKKHQPKSAFIKPWDFVSGVSWVTTGASPGYKHYTTLVLIRIMAACVHRLPSTQSQCFTVLAVCYFLLVLAPAFALSTRFRLKQWVSLKKNKTGSQDRAHIHCETHLQWQPSMSVTVTPT